MQKSKICTVYTLLGIPVFLMRKTVERERIYFLGMKIFSRKNKIERKSGFDKLRKRMVGIEGLNVVVWFDHSLGGGTEVYSDRKIEELREDCVVFRIQYLSRKKKFVVTVIDNIFCDYYILNSFEELSIVLRDGVFQRVVVNNLVGYGDSLKVLGLLKSLRSRRSFHVSVNLHDFQCVCPNFNLMYEGREFCGLQIAKCRHCFSDMGIRMNPLLLSGVKDLDLWRCVWRDFFVTTCDQVFAFSESSKDIFLKMYPEASAKVVVCPHTLPYLRPARVKKHDGLNVAFLGSICSEAKGASVVRNLVLCNKNEKIHFFVIGDFVNPPKNLIVLGKYVIDQLPDIVEEREIDLIIIPSVWPETFSYTTSEAIQLNIPVGSFNMGAQCDKIKGVKRRILFSDKKPETMLREIEDFYRNNG